MTSQRLLIIAFYASIACFLVSAFLLAMKFLTLGSEPFPTAQRWLEGL